MAATMHNQNDKHQSLSKNEETPYKEPSWVKPVKVASVIMSVLIIAGMILLIYGLSTSMGNLAEKTQADRIFTYPEGHRLAKSLGGADGTLVLEFVDDASITKIIHINPNNKNVISTITLQEGQSFGFSE